MLLFQDDTFFTIKDYRRCKLSGHFFNVLFNLNKFMAFESRDPFLIRQVSQFPTSILHPSTTLILMVFHDANNMSYPNVSADA
jgi:hypothetical protein